MHRKADKRSSDKLPVSAISQKSRSHANGVFKGFGTFPNKQQPSGSAQAEIGRFEGTVSAHRHCLPIIPPP